MSVRLEEKVVTEEETLTNLGPAQQLFHYARTGNASACRDLLKTQSGLVNDVDDGINGVYATKNTALHFACQFGHLAVVDLLLAQQANIEARNKLNSTPLHIAAAHGREEIVRFLIKVKANLIAKNAIENTPLHCAIYAGHISCVDALLESVDDIKAALLQTPNGVGMSPAKYASNNEMKEFLRKKFGSSNALKSTHPKSETKENAEESDELSQNMDQNPDAPTDDQKMET